jgi:hypothetical protein
MPIVLKSGSPNLLEPSGPVKACNGIALPLTQISYNEHLLSGTEAKSRIPQMCKLRLNAEKYKGAQRRGIMESEAK